MDRDLKIHTREEVLRALSSEGVQVQKGNEEAPVEINFDGFNAAEPESQARIHARVQDMAKIAREYLSAFLIIDTMENGHQERRMWRHKMQSRFGEAFDKLDVSNKIRKNNIGGIKQYLEFLISELDRLNVKSSKVNAIKSLFGKFPEVEKYEDLHLEEKLEVVRQTDEICRSYLKVVSEKTS